MYQKFNYDMIMIKFYVKAMETNMKCSLCILYLIAIYYSRYNYLSDRLTLLSHVIDVTYNEYTVKPQNILIIENKNIVK